MAARGIVLTPNDEAILSELIRAHKNRPQNTTQRPRRDQDENEAPEVYVARTIENGIPPLVEEPGAGIKDQPGYAYCEVYRITKASTRFELRPIPGLRKRVFNLTLETIPAGQWVLIARDKPGSWHVVRGGSGGADPEIDVEITSFDCGTGRMGFKQIRHTGGKNWEDMPGGITTSDCYHIDAANYPGGPLIAVPTRCRAKPGKLVGSVQHWIVDCPVGYTGDKLSIWDWVCQNSIPIKTMYWHRRRNGQLISEPCHTLVGPCDSCSSAPLSNFLTSFLGRAALAVATLAAAGGALL